MSLTTARRLPPGESITRGESKFSMSWNRHGKTPYVNYQIQAYKLEIKAQKLELNRKKKER